MHVGLFYPSLKVSLLCYALDGYIGKTAEYWLMYLDSMHIVLRKHKNLKYILPQTIFLIENECKTPFHSFSIKNIVYDEMGLRLFYFHLTICYTKLTQQYKEVTLIYV